MRHLSLLGLIGWLVIVPWTVFAQEPDLPPVLDPIDVFTDAVEIVETLPVFEYENGVRLAYYFDPGALAWTKYPYPDALDEILSVVPRADGTFLIGSDETRGVLFESIQAARWVFDPAAGGFNQAAKVCGRVPNLLDTSTWRVFRHSYTERYYLCQMERGERVGPLSEEVWFEDTVLASAPVWESPDGTHVVFSGGSFDEPVMYAYDISAEQVVLLGQPERAGHVEDVHWADETHPLFELYDLQDFLTLRVFLADVTQKNSLRPIADDDQISLLPRYFDDPPRYEWVLGDHVFGQRDVEITEENRAELCSFHAYYLAAREEVIYPPLDYACEVGRQIPASGEDRLILAVEEMDPDAFMWGQNVWLIRFNPITGTQHELFAGTGAWVETITSDGRYALAYVTNNVPSEVFDTDRTVIIDLTTGEIVFEKFGYWSLAIAMYEPETSFLKPLTNNGLILSNDDSYGEHVLVWLEDGAFVEAPLPDEFYRDPQGAYVPIFSRPSDDEWRLELYNAATGDYIPVTQLLSSELYWADVGWQGEDLLWVQIADLERTLAGPDIDPFTNPFVIGAWVIRVP